MNNTVLSHLCSTHMGPTVLGKVLEQYLSASKDCALLDRDLGCHSCNRMKPLTQFGGYSPRVLRRPLAPLLASLSTSCLAPLSAPGEFFIFLCFLLLDVPVAWDCYINHYCRPLLFVLHEDVSLVSCHQCISLDLEVPGDFTLVTLE